MVIYRILYCELSLLGHNKSREQLFAAIHGTVEGKSYIDPSVAAKLFEQFSGALPTQASPEIIRLLSERELDVLRLIAQGLFLSEGTVKNYVSAIFAKLEVSDRTQATIFALRNGLAKL